MKYQKENRKEFFAYIDKLTDEDKYTECIDALESISIGERDYKVCYQLARAYQNFAVIGDDDKGTPNFLSLIHILKEQEPRRTSPNTFHQIRGALQRTPCLPA